jgi:hypothetical protein
MIHTAAFMSTLAPLTPTSFRSPVIFTIGDGPELTSSRLVLQSADWKRFRPRLLIVEATVVNSKEENWQIWEPILIEAEYHKVWFDGLNNFYLRGEDLDLRQTFRLPPNIHDGFETAEVVELKRLASDRETLGKQVEALFSRRRFRWLTRFANWPELKGLTERLKNKEYDLKPASSKTTASLLAAKDGIVM